MSKELLGYIPADGYFERGYLREVPGLHPAVRFTYRPMDIQMLGRLETALAKEKDQAKSYAIQAETVVRLNLLVEWSMVDAKGQPLAISTETLLRVKPAIFIGIVSIITGRGASDLDEEQPHLQSEADRDVLAYIAGEEHPGGTDPKNSATG